MITIRSRLSREGGVYTPRPEFPGGAIAADIADVDVAALGHEKLTLDEVDFPPGPGNRIVTYLW